MTEQRLPLWEAMHSAYMRAASETTPENANRAGLSAEIRAIAEELSKLYADNDPAISIIAFLEDEADRAEIDSID